MNESLCPPLVSAWREKSDAMMIMDLSHLFMFAPRQICPPQKSVRGYNLNNNLWPRDTTAGRGRLSKCANQRRLWLQSATRVRFLRLTPTMHTDNIVVHKGELRYTHAASPSEQEERGCVDLCEDSPPACVGRLLVFFPSNLPPVSRCHLSSANFSLFLSLLNSFHLLKHNPSLNDCDPCSAL